MIESCSNCIFGHTRGTDVFCRLRPPEFIPPNSSVLKPVHPDGWCGEYAAQSPQKYKSAKIKKPATKSVPAPGSAPDSERSSNLSVRNNHDYIVSPNT